LKKHRAQLLILEVEDTNKRAIQIKESKKKEEKDLD